MNKTRRQQLRKWLEDMENIKSELETICSDEQDYFDNMPENLQGSQRGCDSEEAIDQMNEAVSSLEDAISIIEEIV
jgi:chaperonin cofactor prefoldin